MRAAGLTCGDVVSARSLFDDKGLPVGLGQMIIVLDPVRIGGPGAMARLAEMAQRIADMPGAAARPARAKRAAAGDGGGDRGGG